MIKARKPPTQETTLAEARRIANWLLRKLLPDIQVDVVATARAAGIGWLGATPVTYDDDQAVTTTVAAEIAGVVPATIRRWACTPHPDDPTRMLLPRDDKAGRERTYLVSNVRAATVLALTTKLPRRESLPSSRRAA